MESDNDIDEDVDPQSVPPSPMPCRSPPRPTEEQSEALVWWIVAFVSLFQTLHAIPDRAIAWLLKFISVLLGFCSHFSDVLRNAAKRFPKSIFTRNRFLSKHGAQHVYKYVVCSSCHSLHNYQDCYEKRGSSLLVKKCSQVIFSKLCATDLLKRIISKSGAVKLYPIKTYCYSSLISNLQQLLLRPGFVDLCESTRNFVSDTNIFSDVYQGNIWKDFMRVNGKEFLSSALCYGLMMNIDWFQPFDHFMYSVGIVYLVIMNLPRSERYKRQNVLIVGVIPGPKEPPLSINSYLGPLVTELLQLWKGVKLQFSNSSEGVVRVALLAVACDIPAGRKVSGFLGHSANLGCPRCYCEFSEGGPRRNFSNFDRSTWTPRHDRHRTDIKDLIEESKGRSATAVAKMESGIGCRYSVLIDLPYFDPVRMTIIDGMHNLFLGSAKHFTKDILIGTGLLTKQALETIHNRITNALLPIGMGRLPSHIDSGSTFTAEQWMNWTLYFSVYCLHGLISDEHMDCWRHFVIACRTLCNRSITDRDITVADLLLIQFCRRTKRIFGTTYITPNMHLHCHLRECLRDYGPLHSFWLFSFERYNGLLGKLPTNNRSIELQLLQRFLRDGNHLELLNVSKCKPLHKDFYEVVFGHAKEFHSISAESQEESTFFTLPSKYFLQSFDRDMLLLLREAYAYLNPECAELFLDERSKIPSTYKKYGSIQLSGNKVSSICEKQEGKVVHCFATPTVTRSHASTAVSTIDLEPRPVEIQYFIEHSWSVLLPDNSTKRYSHVHAVCEWLQPHPSRHILGKPVEVWCHKLFEAGKFNCFVPLEHIKSRVIVALEKLHEEQVLVFIPIV